MEYNLLTVNGITKICSSNIYTSPSNDIIPLQWYNIQLVWLLKKLDIYPSQESLLEQRLRTDGEYNEMGVDKKRYLYLTNNSIYKILKKHYKCMEVARRTDLKYTLISIPDERFNEKTENNSFEIVQNGFKKPPTPFIANDINNELIFGGYSKFIPELSSNSAYIELNVGEGIEESKDEEISLFSEYEEKTNTKFPFFEGIDTILESSDRSSTESSSELPGKHISADLQKLDVATSWVGDQVKSKSESDPANCYSGFFYWKRNSCYADSIIYLLYTSLLTRQSGTLHTLITRVYTEGELGASQCKDKAPRADNVNAILLTLGKMFVDFNNNKVIYITELLENIMKCISRGENFNDGNPHSPTEFFIILLDHIYWQSVSPQRAIYKIPFIIADTLRTILQNTDKVAIDTFQDMIAQQGGESKITYNRPTRAGPIQVIPLTTGRINDKLKKATWLNGVDGENFILSPSTSLDSGAPVLLKIYDLNIHVDNEIKVLEKIKNGKGIDIEECCYFIEPRPRVDTDDSAPYIIDEDKITNDAEDIFILIDRRTEHGIYKAKIKPKEVIDIDGTPYTLNGIVYMPSGGHYAAVFNCGEKYYKYDDNAGEGGWITKIADNVDDLPNVVVNQSAIYHYIKSSD